MRKSYLTLFSVLMAIQCMAQISRSGKVINQKDRTPMQGVSVGVNGTTNDTSTDASGNFTIHVPDAQSVLVFSYSVFGSREVTSGTAASLTISLEENESALN